MLVDAACKRREEKMVFPSTGEMMRIEISGLDQKFTKDTGLDSVLGKLVFTCNCHH